MVDGSQRLVQQQQLGLCYQRPGNGHPLPFASRQLVWASPQQRANAEQLNRRVQACCVAGQARAFEPKLQIAPHVQMLKQTGLLKHIAQRPPPGRQADTSRGVLPGFARDRDPCVGQRLQTRHAAQQAGLAATRGAKQHGDAGPGQAQVDLEREIRAPQAKPDVAVRPAHGKIRLLRRLNSDRLSSTTKENATMPADSQWAWAYSSASTWP